MIVTEEEIREIFENKETKWTGDNAFQGLQILAKYFPPNLKELIVGVEHDIIYSVSLEDLIDIEIDREDVEKLAQLNWMISEFDTLACFV